MKCLLTLLIVLSSGLATAGTTSYQCVIVSYAGVTDAGKIVDYPKYPDIGKRFAVNKQTGEVIGDVVFGLSTKPKVLAYGSKDNSFKVMWIAEAGGKNGVHADILSIQEFVTGSKKPFAASTGNNLTSGICE